MATVTECDVCGSPRETLNVGIAISAHRAEGAEDIPRQSRTFDADPDMCELCLDRMIDYITNFTEKRRP